MDPQKFIDILNDAYSFDFKPGKNDIQLLYWENILLTAKVLTLEKLVLGNISSTVYSTDPQTKEAYENELYLELSNMVAHYLAKHTDYNPDKGPSPFEDLEEDDEDSEDS